jgi:hypothetical protein
MEGQAIGAGAVVVDAPRVSQGSAWSRLKGAWRQLRGQAWERHEADELRTAAAAARVETDAFATKRRLVSRRR